MSEEIILSIVPAQKRIRKFTEEFQKLSLPKPIPNEPAKTAEDFWTHLMLWNAMNFKSNTLFTSVLQLIIPG